MDILKKTDLNKADYEQMSDEINNKMSKTIEYMKSDLSNIHTGRANPGLINKILVECYNTQTPLNSIASITCPESRTLVIQPYDTSTIDNIKKAINKANIGINPISDGKIIRLIIPELSNERRNTLVKQVINVSEQYKITIRNIRRDYNEITKNMQKNNIISKNDLEFSLDSIQQLTNKYIKQIEDMLVVKKKDIMSV